MSPPPRIWRPTLAVFPLLLIVYAATACRTVGPGDSGELTVVMSHWGVAHAPGYPLLSLIGNLVSLLPHPGEPAFILNLLSGLFAALAGLFVALAVEELTGSAAGGIFAGLALGVSRVFWEYSLVVEVFSLNSLCGAVLLYFLARLIKGLDAPTPPLWPLPASAAVMATAITHHLTLVLVAVPVALVEAAIVVTVLRRRVAAAALARTLGWSVAAGVAALLPLAYLPLAARGHPVLNWDNPITLSGLVRLLKREDFGSGTLMSPWAVAGAVMEHGEKVSPLGGRHFLRFWMELPRSFGWAFLPLLAWGALAAAARRSRWLGLFLAAFVAMILVFFLRVNSPVLPLYLGVTERFYILPHVVMAFCAGLGVAGLAALARARLPGVGAPLVLAAALVAVPGAMFLVNWPHVNMRGDTFTRDFGTNFMAGIPPDAIVLSEGDLVHNAFYYQQLGLGRRPDLEFVDQQKLTYAWYTDEVRRRGRFVMPAGMTRLSGEASTQSKSWLDLNLKPDGTGRPVVAVSLRDNTYATDYQLTPMGLWWRAWPRSKTPPLAERANECERVLAQWDLSSLKRRYHDRSWETAEAPLYAQSLAQAAALIDLAENLKGGGAPVAPSPRAARWFDLAAGLPGSSAAAVKAWQAQELHRILTDGVTDLTAAGGPGPVLKKALALLEEAVREDPRNVTALGSLAALMRADPAGYSPRREAEVRQALLDAAPGDVAAVGAYVQLVIDMTNNPTTRDPALVSDAVAREKRLIGLLEIAERISKDDSSRRNLDQWRGYLTQTEALLGRVQGGR